MVNSTTRRSSWSKKQNPMAPNYAMQRIVHGPQGRASCAPREFGAVRALIGQHAAAERGR